MKLKNRYIELKNKLFQFNKRNQGNNNGFQLKESELGKYLNNFLNKEQKERLIYGINNFGYLSVETGEYLKKLINDSDNYLYIKSIHSKDIESIFSEGVRCLNNSSSISSVNPTSINDVKLDSSITKIDLFPILLSLIKGNNGFSQGYNAIDGTLIMLIPKELSKEDMLYFNQQSHTYNIKPEFIIGFLPVDQEKNVKDWIFPKKNVRIK